MCAHQTSSKKTIWLSTPFLYLVMITLGIISGYSDISLLKNLGSFVSEFFIRIFKCLSLPLITLSVIVTLSRYHSEKKMQNTLRLTIFYALGTTFIAACVSFVLYFLINPTLTHTQGASFTIQQTNWNYLEYISNLVPNNFFAPFIQNQVISALFLGIIIGIATRFIPDTKAKDTVNLFFKGLHSLVMVITKWIIAIIPIGLFGFITITVIQLRSGMAIGGVGQYLMVIILANLIQGAVILPLWLKSQGFKPLESFKGMLPALNLAFFSKSSVGTLPLTISTIEQNLKVRPEISRFALPFCTSINMNGCAAFIFTTVIYLMQSSGIELSLGTIIVWILIATIAALGNAGVPMGCFFLSASLLSSMNVPITLLGVILPFYSIIDMVETSVNVWSDACIAQVVNKKTKDKAEVFADDASLYPYHEK